MKKALGLIFGLLLWSCGPEKVLELPKISHAKIQAVSDVSAAYLFYNNQLKDSIELNRKNLISTTNWLVNVDKRLSLNQVVPKLKFIQEKKHTASPRNTEAKNYFTCNDTINNTLGFIDFTTIEYHLEDLRNAKLINQDSTSNQINLSFKSLDDVVIIDLSNHLKLKKTTLSETNKELKLMSTENKFLKIILSFQGSLTFQDYITLKSGLSILDSNSIIISNHEFVFN